MGRAASSCLKIMACGGRGGTAGGDDDAAAAPPPPDEAKSPQDKAKWNFLRSSRNQVTSNNIAVSGPLASVPEKDEDSEASNKGGSPQQPEQATAAAAGGKVRMMKFAEFVPKLSFHLTEPELLDSLSVVKDGGTDSTDASHQKSQSSEEQLPVKDDVDGSSDIPEESKASKEAAPACDAATTETGHSAKDSVAVENDAAAKDSIPPSRHASEASTHTRQSVDVEHSLIRESAAIKIQTAARAYLAELALKKHNNATKLQAAVRGYLVRREAVGTLRCVQAILKMQALVRARRMNQNPGKLDKKEPLEALVQEDELDYLGKESSACGNNALGLLNEKLLKTGFILQLLESTPRSKCIYISCEPSRSDSAWRWLERWMTLISSDSLLQPEPNLGTAHHVPEEPVGLNCSKEPSEISTAVHLPEIPMPCDPVPNIVVKENIDCGDAPECHAATSTRGLIDEAEEYLLDRDASDEASEAGKSDADEPSFGKLETQSSGMDIEPAKERSEVEDSNKADETSSSQQKEPEMYHCTSELIESHNAELSAEDLEVKSLNVEEAPSHLEKEPLSIEIPIPCSHSVAESLHEENADSHEPIIHAPSESDTETSVSSSSESRNSSESESEEVACEKGITELEKHAAKNVFTDFVEHGDENYAKDNPSETLFNETVDENVRLTHSADEPAKSGLSAQPTASDEQDVHENVGQSHSANEEARPELSAEPMVLDERELNENGGNKQAYSSSPERSPSHHIIKANSYETPPSQIPVNTENVNGSGNHVNQKQSSREPTSRSALSETKYSSDSKPDPSVSDLKTAKKRHSIGSNNSLPSYMQATESAKAKVHASVSPKSSPDLKDSNRKKRLSLPAGTEKHNLSPRMQRSGSQVQQNSKANGVHVPLNFSERRWQR